MSNEKMRSDFEDWASDKGLAQRAVTRNGDGYLLAIINSYWLAWQAALSQQPAQVSQPVAYIHNHNGEIFYSTIEYLKHPIIEDVATIPIRVDYGVCEFKHKESRGTPLFSSPPDYEALRVENEALNLKLSAMEPKP